MTHSTGPVAVRTPRRHDFWHSSGTAMPATINGGHDPPDKEEARAVCARHRNPAAGEPNQRKPRRPARRRLLWAGGILAAGTATIVAGGAGAYLATRYPGGEAHSGWLAIRGATALAGEGLEPVTDAIVLVQDGRIIDVDSRLEIPEGAEILDAPGATVLPGLIDMHTHMIIPDLDGSGDGSGLLGTADYLWHLARYMPDTRRDFLEHGVTTIRDLGGELEWCTELRDGIEDGTLEGPRAFIAGSWVTTPDGHPNSESTSLEVPPEATRTPTTPQEAEQVIAELCDGERPVDVVKVVHDSGASDLQASPHDPRVLATLAEAAHERGVPLTAHCGTPTEIGEAVEAGIDGIEHLTLRDSSAPFGSMDTTASMPWPEGLVDQLAEAGTMLDPTLLVELDLPENRSPERTELAERRFERLLEAHAAGVRIVAGSDAGMAIPGFGSGLVDEVQMLGEAGLPTRDVLRAATSEAAAALPSEQIGVLEAGRAADLLIIDGDPLADLTALRDVMGVLRDGRVVAGDLREA